MYCKHCGSPLEPNSVQCRGCGAKINLFDGGQSFFEDGELDEWKGGGFTAQPVNPLPKTEILDMPKDDEPPAFAASPQQAEAAPPFAASPQRAEAPEARMQRPRASAPTAGGGRSTGRRKKKKKLLSKPNRLIVSCVSCVVVVAFGAIGIMRLIGPGASPVMPDGPAAGMPAQSATAEPDAVRSSDSPAGQEPVGGETGSGDADVINPTAPPEATLVTGHLIGGAKDIDKDFYIYHGILYLPVDSFVDAMGEEYSFNADTENPNEYAEYNIKDGAICRIKKFTNEMWIIRDDIDQPMKLADNTFNDGAETYVPAESFLENIGINYNIDEKNTITLTD